MYLEDDFEKNNNDNNGKFTSLIVVISTVFVFMVVIFVVVLIVNRDELGGSNIQIEVVSSEKGSVEELLTGEKIVSDDLDIWTEFPSEDTNKKDVSSDTFGISVETEDKTTDEKEDDPSEGGLKTKIVHSNGTEEWQYINQYLDLQDYEKANFVLKDGRLAYYLDGKKVSYTGVSVGKYNGYVDFNKLAKDGIDFCMIRMGGRTYSTGQLSMDEYFFDNMKRATDAGLDIGLLFESQAINVAEAEEEAKYVLDNIGEYEIEYPICFCMEPVANDEARIDKLSKEDRTKITRAFMDKIVEGGYTPVLYGDKEWLLTKLNYASISYYDIWLKQYEDLPDYPYDFKMWEYKTAAVDGISGKTELTISFIDYSRK